MADSLEQKIIEIVQEALRNNGAEQDVTVTAVDSMETLAAWDSLTFMSVFLAINEAFELEPDFDEAIHYISVPLLYAYLKEQVA
jgi:acyl carrier protein